MQGQGLALMRGGRRIRLKWHRLHLRRADPEFDAGVMARGFALGASMELDLRCRADGGFVVIHDELLDRETTGQGRVAMMARHDLAALCYRGGQRRLILSEDLADLMPQAHPEALLQFDMKDDLARIGTRGVDHLADLFGGVAAALIVSGDCPDLIRAIAARLPQIRRGIDPTDRLAVVLAADGPAAAEAALRAEIRGGAAPDTVYLNWELLLQAKARGLDLVALSQAEGTQVDAWTYTLKDPVRGFDAAEWAQIDALTALGPDQITTDEALATEAAWLAAPALSRQ